MIPSEWEGARDKAGEVLGNLLYPNDLGSA